MAEPRETMPVVTLGSLLVVAALVGCGSSTPSPVTTTPPVAPVGCAARVERIDTRLRDLSRRVPGFMPLVRDIRAPSSTTAKPIDARGFVVAIARDGRFIVQGQVLSPTDAYNYFDAMYKRALESHVVDGGSSSDARFPIYLWIDADTPIAKVAELTKILGRVSDKWSIRYLTAGPADPAAPPAGGSLPAGKMPATEPESTDYLVGQLKRSVGDCTAVITAAAASGSEPPWKATEMLLAELPKALRACDCKLADLDLFEWGIYEWFGASTPPLRYHERP